MSASNFNTRNDTWRKLLGNGISYKAPRFQRDYSWSDGEWDDLWQDVIGTIRAGGEPAHYMGYLVLQSSDERNFDIIDGQQRLTTLSIILAAMKNIKRLIDAGANVENNKRRLEGLRQAYVGSLNPVTLVASSKLSLNRNNDHYYQTYLVPLADLPKRGFKASEHALRKAFEWFDKKIENKIVRYLLGKLETQMGGSAPDPQSDTLSIEHVCPVNPTEQWENFSDDDIEAFSARLGNMTLLETTKNRALGEENFESKRAVYESSSFLMTRKLAEQNAEWTPDRISRRQEYLAKQATATWRIAQLSQIIS